MFDSIFSGTESGGWGSPKGSCGIARVEAGLALLNNLVADKSALVFDWDNSDSVAHESQRNSLLNTLVADISHRRTRPGGDSPTWQGIKARLRKRSSSAECAEHLLNETASPLQYRCSSPLTTSPRRGSRSGGAEPRHVSLMFWPPEVIPPSCFDYASKAALPRRTKGRRASVFDAALEEQLVSVAALLLEARRRGGVRGTSQLKGILLATDTSSAASSPARLVRIRDAFQHQHQHAAPETRRSSLGPSGSSSSHGPLGSSSSQHRRTPELVLQKSHASSPHSSLSSTSSSASRHSSLSSTELTPLSSSSESSGDGRAGFLL
ncbi:hypothetical protein T484DRAFT_1974216 [Baffinella frigidus]|nr:hypothetical protein T484DRAFT_1974216 [Cryptophyta sp. CCMP2293]